MKLFIYSFFIIISIIKTNSSVSQISKIDSLKTVFKVKTSKKEKVDILNDLFTLEYDSDYNRALEYANYALKIAKLLDQDSIDNQKRLSKTYNNIGIAYLLLANYDESLKNLFTSLDISESIKDTLLISNTINNIGALYGNKGELAKSYYYFSRSAELDELSGNLDGAADAYSNLALYYFTDSIYTEGEIYYNKAMKIYKETGNDNKIATLYLTKALGMLNQKKHRKSLKYYNLAISIFLNSNSYGSLTTSYINVSYLYSKINNQKEAERYGLLALEIAKKLNSPDHIMKAYESLFETNEETENLRKALKYMKKYTTWKDTIYNRESTEAMAKYNFDKEEKENKILKQVAAINLLEMENNQKVLESSRIIMYSAIGGGILLFLLTFMLYNRNKLKQKTNDKLQFANTSLTEAKEIIEEKNRDITASIQYAKYIQHAILPKKESIAESFDESFLLLLPKDVVSGDFYWFKKVNGYSILVLADCTGHGVPGGFMSMMGAEMLNQVISDPKIMNAGHAIAEIDKRIISNLNQVGSKLQQNDGMDIALCVFDFEKGILHFSGANRPLIRVRNNELTMLKPNRYGAGGVATTKKTFLSEELDIKKGDSYYMYSDGFPDQFGGPKNKKFMRKRLNNLILEQSSLNMEQQETNFLKTFHDWKSNMKQIDDVCLIGVKV
jgi:serine phosphatase RsbU (regulator of sigma subunit)